ncbi:MAG: hypothetical protein K2G36_02880 [Ruminococcus sp.]|nr:hypothetical protein [Ruminococcus sp.]
MKIEYSYLVAGRFFVDLLKEKDIIYSKEDLRRFNIGLLNTQNLKINPVFKLIKMAEPYYMGYYFQIWLNKQTNRDNTHISESEYSTDKKYEHESMRKYKLCFPDILPFFSPGKKVKFEDYIRINSELKDKIDITTDPNLTKDELKSLDDESIYLMGLAVDFFHEHKKMISVSYLLNKKLFVINKNKSYPANSVWNADEMQYDYYHKRWIEICKMTKPDSINKDNAIAFFDGLLQELEDVDFNGKRDRDSWKKEDEKIIKTSKLITIISGFATLFSTAEEFSAEDDIISIFNEMIENSGDLPSVINFFIKLLGLVAPVIVMVISAKHTYLIQKSEREDHRETWLRHKLYYSKLIMEIEKFCSGSGNDYKAIKEINKWKIHECISKFQENIAKLKKEDYDNFFKNMDCVNYELDD